MNEVILAIIALLQAQFTTQYKKYFYGEVKVPNQSMMPFLEVIPLGSRIDNRGTGRLSTNEYRIQVNIKSSLKKYLKENTAVSTIDHIQDLVLKAEDRDTLGNVETATVLGVLQNNLQLSSTAHIVGQWEIRYDEIELRESYITVASISFVVQKITN